MAKTNSRIIVRGARQHNLKGLNVTIPKHKLVVLTGVSGSGKSSLAFDTIYAEGQRRYVESLSTYARQFLGQMEKPRVEYVGGLSPAVSIEQKSVSRNPRSTVGTITEIYDYLRILYARVGVPHCTKCGREIGAQTSRQIVDQILGRPQAPALILAPVARDDKRDYQRALQTARAAGFARVRIDGELRRLDQQIKLDARRKHAVEVVVDRLTLRSTARARVAEAVEQAAALSDGEVILSVNGEDHRFSRRFACVPCGLSYDELTPQSFSFNHAEGMCPACGGLGVLTEFDENLVLPNKDLTIRQGAVALWGPVRGRNWRNYLETMAAHFGFDLDTPVKDLRREHIRILLYGSDQEFEVTWHYRHGHGKRLCRHGGVVAEMERWFSRTKSEGFRNWCVQFMRESTCRKCRGRRLRPESLAVTFRGKNIAEMSALNVGACRSFLDGVKLTPSEAKVAEEVLWEIRQRLRFLCDVGLHYLTLDRSAPTLSGGEAQRIRLASQIGSGLVGVLYILDEPSIGLHQRDNARLLDTLKRLRDLHNTVLVIEHDLETIRRADFIVDLGPGAGVHGGEVVVTGPPSKVARCRKSVTGQFLSGRRKIALPAARRTPTEAWLTVIRARHNNLRGIDVRFPLRLFTCVTGVSGSGKSSLVSDTLYRALARRLHGAREKPGPHQRLEGLKYVDQVINVDQSPFTRNPRSNVALYVGAFDLIRELFAQLPESRRRGFRPGRFSFNKRGGRCEVCRGYGARLVQMHFLADVWVPCEACRGTRFNRETLRVRHKGKTIADVLEMTVDEARDHFASHPRIARRLQTLADVGLGYVKLGQTARTLSGGEAQRVKLARELARRATGNTVYILDEPTTGLHCADIELLLQVLQRLVDAGNTVIVIEHNLDVIKCADHVIDLGPEGGDEGGTVVVAGTPEQVAACPQSHTGRFLRPVLQPSEQSDSSRSARAGTAPHAGHTPERSW